MRKVVGRIGPHPPGAGGDFPHAARQRTIGANRRHLPRTADRSRAPKARSHPSLGQRPRIPTDKRIRAGARRRMSCESRMDTANEPIKILLASVSPQFARQIEPLPKRQRRDPIPAWGNAPGYRPTNRIRAEGPPHRMPQSHGLLMAHLVFSTKDRQPFLDTEIRPRLHAYLATVARNID